MTAKAFDLRGATAGDFVPLVGESFAVGLEEEGPPLTEFVLTEVEGPKSERARPFSLIFRGPPEAELPQMTVYFNHPKLAAFGLFVVPIGASEQGREYQAVFN